jgi:uncharacterized protein (DUF2147 family)
MNARWSLLPMLLIASSHTAWADTITGLWLTDAKDAVVFIENCGQKMCGRIERVLDPKLPTKDINNPDPKLRSRAIIGTFVLSNFVSSGTGWKDGQAYDPKTGKSYKSKMQLLASGRLKVSGCILFLCEDRYWTRMPGS